MVDSAIGWPRNTRQRYWVEQSPTQPSKEALKSVMSNREMNVAYDWDMLACSPLAIVPCSRSKKT
jgi:hypothetical protein